MEDFTGEMLPEKPNQDHVNLYRNEVETFESDQPTQGEEESDEDTATSINEDGESSTNRGSLRQGPTLPILQKVINLSDKIQILKRDHSILSKQVKNVVGASFPGHDVLETLQLLSNKYELLKNKYLQESLERKLLQNEVIELKGNIRVFCRYRPLNQVETANGSTNIVEFDASNDNELQIISSDFSKKQFKFDHVFRPDDSQEAVFAQSRPVVTSVMDGYNVCIFAYGQTGTGKTFTMEGIPENRGVTYRTLEELFRISHERSDIMQYELFVSMLEVYNEKIRDLLENSDRPGKRLEIKQSTEGTREVPGLSETHICGTEEVWELLKSGSRARSVASTNANELSSRSHCLVRVAVKGKNLVNRQKTKSHLWLVDLAGSERVGKIEVEGERLKESQFINKSLSALGDVISALASKTGHVPYRNSKLTHMLQSSLGGECKTLMFLQISPSSADLGETLCSLNFASRVRGIESGPACKQSDLSDLLKYKQMAEKLKQDEKETKKLQDTLQSLQLRLAAREHICKSLQEKVRDLENQLGEERKARVKQETRAFAAASSRPPPLSVKASTDKCKTERKPPLGPSKLRLPLRRISNFVPPPSPLQTNKNVISSSFKNLPYNSQDKENFVTNTKSLLMKPRRISTAVRPPRPPSSTTSKQLLKPRRRVSIATLLPESNMTTPLRTFAIGRPLVAGETQKLRCSRLFSPMPESKRASSQTMTPIAMRSFKFMRSPPSQGTSWIPRHPTVIALQRKSLVWSPLKSKSMKASRRPSLLLPSRSSSTEMR